MSSVPQVERWWRHRSSLSPDSKTKQIHSSQKLHNGIPESFTRVGSNCLQPSDHRIMWPPNVCWKPNCQIRWVVKVWRFVGHNSEVLTVKWSKQRRQRSTDGFTIESQKQTELIWYEGMTENPKIGRKRKIRGNQGRETEFKRKEKSMVKMTKDNSKNKRTEGF